MNDGDLMAALAKIMPMRVADGPDCAEVYFSDGESHSTQAMTMNPQDWIDIQQAYDAAWNTRADAKAGEVTSADAPPVKQSLTSEAVIREALLSELGDAYDCGRVWEAWSVGTMGEDDFSPISDRVDDIVGTVMAALQSASAAEPVGLREARIGTKCKRCGTHAPKAFASECNRPECEYRTTPARTDDGGEAQS